jgi:hypothetical protein
MNKIYTILATSVFALALTGCNDDATVARHNMTKAADNFELMRRIVFLQCSTWSKCGDRRG